jgi:ribosomal protein S12 methylthiotransferase accessory factor
MFQYINRPYKERSTGETIDTIKEILASLDLMPEETLHGNPYPGVHWVSLELVEDRGGFRTNGKGRDTEFALASAYAEFMERMQNGLYSTFSRTILTTIKGTHGFFHWPDERFLSAGEFGALPREVIADTVRLGRTRRSNFISSYFQRVEANNLPGVVSVPFYDTLNRGIIHLPLNLLLLAVGSNGMAAGNTPAEAIFQALCELLERWGAAEVFYRRLTPPTVPRAFLRQFDAEYEIIRTIEKSGKYKVTFKDFSAGRRIPALGLILLNREANTYRLNVGSDTGFQVALSRCLTEIYQGFADEENLDARLLPVPQEEAPYFERDDELSLFQRSLVFAQFTKDNSGVFPVTLFGDQPHYAFDPSVFTTKDSYEREVKALVSYFHKAGYNVYIRDVSFLGFPSVFVYVPDVSTQGRKSAVLPTGGNPHLMLHLDKIEPMIFRLSDCTKQELFAIAEVLENLGGANPIAGLFNVRLKQASEWKELCVAFLLTQIWIRLGRYDRARKSFGRFLETRGDNNPYYSLVEKYLTLRDAGLSEQEVSERLLRQPTPKDIVSQVCQDLSDPTKVFDFIKLPSCPNCADCRLNKECITVRAMNIAQTLYPVMDRNRIDQQTLSWVS